MARAGGRVDGVARVATKTKTTTKTQGELSLDVEDEGTKTNWHQHHTRQQEMRETGRSTGVCRLSLPKVHKATLLSSFPFILHLRGLLIPILGTAASTSRSIIFCMHASAALIGPFSPEDRIGFQDSMLP